MKGCVFKGSGFVFCFVIGMFLLANPALAADFCVGTAEELIIALATAASNGQDDTIKIQQGTYEGSFVYASTEAFGITFEGGNIAGCSERVVDATNTVLDGKQNGTVLVLSAPDVAADFTVDGLTMRNGYVSDREGSGIFLMTQGKVSLLKNVFTNNMGESPYRHSVDITFANIVTLTNNIISDNDGGVDIVRAENVNIVGNTIVNNNGDQGGGLRISASDSVFLMDNKINSNDSGNSDGGGIFIQGSIVKLTDNYIQNNITQKFYGGAYIQAGTVSLFNNVISGNEANSYHQPYWDGGGGVHIRVTNEVNLINNTVSDNDGAIGGGGICLLLENDETHARIYNNIIFNNIAQEGADIYITNDYNTNYVLSPVYLFNNDFDQSEAGTYIQTSFPIDPSNLNNVDPIFVDSANSDYRLTGGSPCINTGNDLAPELPTTDKDGNPRIVGTAVDIGAYEYQGFVTPVAAFKGEPVTGIASLNVQFTDLSSGSVETWEWNFGDGSSSTLRNPPHTYNEPGIYTVKLTVTGGSYSDTEEKTNYITAISPGAPDLVGKIKDFHAMQYCKNVSLSLQVENLGSEDACDFKIDLYHSTDGYTLGDLVDERTISNCVKGGTSHNVGLRYFSENVLSGEYLIYFIDSLNNVRETNEYNNKKAIKIP